MPYSDPDEHRRRSKERTRKYRADPVRGALIKARAKERRKDVSLWAANSCYQIKYRARKAGIPFGMSPEDIPLPAACPVFGTPFVLGKHLHPRSPTVDRIRPALGYVAGNVRVISHRANAIKNDSVSSTEILQVALYMEREGL